MRFNPPRSNLPNCLGTLGLDRILITLTRLAGSVTKFVVLLPREDAYGSLN